MIRLSDFIGDWQLQRRIHDDAYGQHGSLAGTARFHANGAVVDYHEQGRLTLAGGMTMQAERSYIWQPDPQGVTVKFADGAPFHRFDLGGKVKGTQHLCGADLYNVTYNFESWPAWSATWVVAGPRKNYTSVSHYKPV